MTTSDFTADLVPRAHLHRKIQRMRALARRWGGDILVFKNDDAFIKAYNSLGKGGEHWSSFAPFTHRSLAVAHTRRLILAVEPDWIEVVHEMGHVFATNQPPARSNELGFLGWEFALVRYLGGGLRAWRDNNRDYCLGRIEEHPGLQKFVGDNSSTDILVGDISPAAFRCLVTIHLENAIARQLVSPEGHPLNIREDTP